MCAQLIDQLIVIQKLSVLTTKRCSRVGQQEIRFSVRLFDRQQKAFRSETDHSTRLTLMFATSTGAGFKVFERIALISHHFTFGRFVM